MIDFECQVALATGAGRGLGRLYALDFAARASEVVDDLGGGMRGDYLPRPVRATEVASALRNIRE